MLLPHTAVHLHWSVVLLILSTLTAVISGDSETAPGCGQFKEMAETIGANLRLSCVELVAKEADAMTRINFQDRRQEFDSCRNEVLKFCESGRDMTCGPLNLRMRNGMMKDLVTSSGRHAVQVTCLSDYQLIGDDLVTCDETTGHWSSLPECWRNEMEDRVALLDSTEVVCMTAECREEAKELRAQAIDEDIDPCEDSFGFATGRVSDEIDSFLFPKSPFRHYGELNFNHQLMLGPRDETQQDQDLQAAVDLCVSDTSVYTRALRLGSAEVDKAKELIQSKDPKELTRYFIKTTFSPPYTAQHFSAFLSSYGFAADLNSKLDQSSPWKFISKSVLNNGIISTNPTILERFIRILSNNSETLISITGWCNETYREETADQYWFDLETVVDELELCEPIKEHLTSLFLRMYSINIITGKVTDGLLASQFDLYTYSLLYIRLYGLLEAKPQFPDCVMKLSQNQQVESKLMNTFLTKLIPDIAAKSQSEIEEDVESAKNTVINHYMEALSSNRRYWKIRNLTAKYIKSSAKRWFSRLPFVKRENYNLRRFDHSWLLNAIHTGLPRTVKELAEFIYIQDVSTGIRDTTRLYSETRYNAEWSGEDNNTTECLDNGLERMTTVRKIETDKNAHDPDYSNRSNIGSNDYLHDVFIAVDVAWRLYQDSPHSALTLGEKTYSADQIFWIKLASQSRARLTRPLAAPRDDSRLPLERHVTAVPAAEHGSYSDAFQCSAKSLMKKKVKCWHGDTRDWS